MPRPIAAVGTAVNLTATGFVNPTAAKTCQLHGFYVNSTAGGTLVLRKDASNGTAISGTITPAIGWHAFPADVGGPLHVTIAVAALDVTFLYSA